MDTLLRRLPLLVVLAVAIFAFATLSGCSFEGKVFYPDQVGGLKIGDLRKGMYHAGTNEGTVQSGLASWKIPEEGGGH